MPYPIESGTVTDDNLPNLGRRWCPTCRRTQDVHDVAGESDYAGHREVAYVATHLACGHSVHRDATVTRGGAPGGMLTGTGWDL